MESRSGRVRSEEDVFVVAGKQDFQLKTSISSISTNAPTPRERLTGLSCSCSSVTGSAAPSFSDVQNSNKHIVEILVDLISLHARGQGSTLCPRPEGRRKHLVNSKAPKASKRLVGMGGANRKSVRYVWSGPIRVELSGLEEDMMMKWWSLQKLIIKHWMKKISNTFPSPVGENCPYLYRKKCNNSQA